MTPTLVRYTNTNEMPFHYSGGVLCLAESALLSEDEARWGIDAGVLIETPKAAPKTKSASAPDSENQEN